MAYGSKAFSSREFVVTERGSYDLRTADTCQCNPRLSGLLITCPDCGTIYGSLSEQALPAMPREKRRWD